MEPVYEVRGVVTEKTYRAFNSMAMGYLPMIRRFSFGGGTILLVLGLAVTLLIPGTYLLFALAALLLVIVAPKMAKKKAGKRVDAAIKTDREMFDQPYTVRFHEKEAVVSAPDGERTVSYTSLVQILETGRFLVLYERGKVFPLLLDRPEVSEEEETLTDFLRKRAGCRFKRIRI